MCGIEECGTSSQQKPKHAEPILGTTAKNKGGGDFIFYTKLVPQLQVAEHLLEQVVSPFNVCPYTEGWTQP